MLPLCGNLRIRVEECRLDEELVGTARQRDDPVDIPVVISGVDHVGNLLAAPGAQRMLLKHAERDGQVAPDDDLAVVRLAPPHRAFGFVEPWADSKPEQLESVAPHVDTQLFLERKGKAWRAMIEHNTRDTKLVFIQECSGWQPGRRLVALAEAFPGAKFAHAVEPNVVELASCDDKIGRTFVEKIQGICFELVVDPVAEPGRTDEMKRHRPTQTDAQEPIEA